VVLSSVCRNENSPMPPGAAAAQVFGPPQTWLFRVPSGSDSSGSSAPYPKWPDPGDNRSRFQLQIFYGIANNPSIDAVCGKRHTRKQGTVCDEVDEPRDALGMAVGFFQRIGCECDARLPTTRNRQPMAYVFRSLVGGQGGQFALHRDTLVKLPQ